MEVYLQIRRDIMVFLFWFILCGLLINFFGYGTDETDQSGWRRSGFELLTDYGTGKQYLYKDGVIIERVKDK